ncbi:MAG: hypothetical protein KGH79_01350 [Patescibacteria group bacterium]|nr:hypothetical protein [Patescibacteria group bacterium]
MESPFSINESLTFGWTTLKAHSALVFKIVLTLLALQVAYAIVTKVLAGTALGFLAAIVLFIAEVVLGIGATLVTLKLAKGEYTTYNDIVPPARLAWRYVLASLLAGLIIVCGLILLIIPGIYVILRYSMVRFAVLDGAGVAESLRKSAAMTRGVKWHLLGFFVVAILLNIAGAILLLVGLLVTIPVTMIAAAHIYTKLLAR